MIFILILLFTESRPPLPKELQSTSKDAESLSFEENTLFRIVTFSALSIFVILVTYLLRVYIRLGGDHELTASDLAAVRMITMDTREKSMHQSALSSLTGPQSLVLVKEILNEMRK